MAQFLRRRIWTTAVVTIIKKKDEGEDVMLYDEFMLDKPIVSGDLQSVCRLLVCSTTDPSEHYNLALWLAVEHRHEDIVRVLLADSRVDPNARRGFIVHEAIRKRMINICLLLVTHPLFDVTNDRQGAIFWAADYDVAEVVQVLLEDPRVDVTEDVIRSATGKSRRLLVAHDKWGVSTQRKLYEKYYPDVVQEYDALLAQALTMAWLAEQVITWKDLVWPLSDRIKASFII